MLTFLLVVHILITLGMVACILLQRSEGGGFVSSASSFMTVRGSANFLTRLTAIFASAFILLSLVLAILAGGYKKNRSILDQSHEDLSAPATVAEKSAPTKNTDQKPEGSPSSALEKGASSPSKSAHFPSSNTANDQALPARSGSVKNDQGASKEKPSKQPSLSKERTKNTQQL